MITPFIVGVSGLAGSGKDTVATMLMNQVMLRYDVALVRLADPIYDGIKAMFGIDIRSLDREVKESPVARLCGRSPRYVLQTLGTEWGRHLIDPKVWLTVAMSRASKTGAEVVVIPDIRFPDEAQWAYDKGMLLYVERTGTKKMDHVSEQLGRPPGSVKIENNGTLPELNENIRKNIAPLVIAAARGRR